MDMMPKYGNVLPLSLQISLSNEHVKWVHSLVQYMSSLRVTQHKIFHADHSRSYKWRNMHNFHSGFIMSVNTFKWFSLDLCQICTCVRGYYGLPAAPHL